MSTLLIPHTAAEAAEAYKEKIPFVSVQLEADKNLQSELQALAFRLMGIEMEGTDWTIDDFRVVCALELKEEPDKFTERELHSVESLAYVALKHGYAKTIAKFPESQRHLIEF